MDKFSKEERSKIMSKIHSYKTTPELALKRELRGLGFSYQPKMYGNPDFANKKKRIAIFVDGDFWHGYTWKNLKKVPPKKYWQDKIKKNIARDKIYNKKLKKKGWNVIRLWEHDIIKNTNYYVKKIANLKNT